MKRCSTSYVIREMQIKTTWDSSIQPLERPKSRTLTTPNAAEDVEQQERSFTAGLQNGTAILEDSLEVSQKTKNTLTIQNNNCTP